MESLSPRVRSGMVEVCWLPRTPVLSLDPSVGPPVVVGVFVYEFERESGNAPGKVLDPSRAWPSRSTSDVPWLVNLLSFDLRMLLIVHYKSDLTNPDASPTAPSPTAPAPAAVAACRESL